MNYYNDSNEAQKVDMQRAFTLGGLLFGLYMIFTFSLAFVNFPPVLSLCKAVLISLIAISTLSTFIFSIYLVFGRRLGLLIDAAAILTWAQMSDLEVMGIWTLGATIRSYLAIAFILVGVGIVMGRFGDANSNQKLERIETSGEKCPLARRPTNPRIHPLD